MTVNVAYDKDTPPEKVHQMYQEAHTRIRKDLAARGISVDPTFRYLGVEGYDIVWGNEPQANHAANQRLRFAVIWIPLSIAVSVVLLHAGYRGWKARRTIATLPTQIVEP
ncbi:MAG TPA: hypothetical protein PLN21_11920 [Gemmatales bacterium]|nr:hypothetical protein [Gemmatales bacterium]